jgi:uncharacterized OsmC-like protein
MKKLVLFGLLACLTLSVNAQIRGKKMVDGKEVKVLTKKDRRDAKRMMKEWQKGGWEAQGKRIEDMANVYQRLTNKVNDDGTDVWKIVAVEWTSNSLAAAKAAADMVAANEIANWLQREVLSYSELDFNTQDGSDNDLAKFTNISASLARQTIGQPQEIAYLVKKEGKRYKVKLIVAYNYENSLQKMLELMIKQEENNVKREKFKIDARSLMKQNESNVLEVESAD